MLSLFFLDKETFVRNGAFDNKLICELSTDAIELKIFNTY